MQEKQADKYLPFMCHFMILAFHDFLNIGALTNIEYAHNQENNLSHSQNIILNKGPRL